jgi:hypothetical protein
MSKRGRSGRGWHLTGTGAGDGTRCAGCRRPVVFGDRCEDCKRELRKRQRRKPR